MSGAATLRACQNCSKSKAKCISQADPTNEKCARCFRLSKECMFALRTTRKRKSPNTHLRTSQLEEKIESLAALLAVQQKAVRKSLSLTPESIKDPAVSSEQVINKPGSSWNQTPLSINSKTTWTRQFSVPSSSEVIAQGSAPSYTTSTTYPILPSLSGDTPSIPDLQLYEEDWLLGIFRERCSPCFPFVIIPSSISASELKMQSPWLLQAIIIVANQGHRARQIDSMKTIMSEIANAMLVRGEISLDVLHSLLILNAWFYHLSSAISPTPTSSALNQLLIAAVFDLGLNRPVQDKVLPAEILNENIKDFPENEAKNSKRSTEDRRALLSVYFLTSVFCWSIKRIDGLQHSPYIEYCCQRLLEASECENDVVLVALARIQFILEKANRIPLNSGAGAPVWMYVKASRLELQTCWRSIPDDVRQNRILVAHYHSADLVLLEPCLRKGLFAKIHGKAAPERLDMLYASLTSAKLVLDLLTNQPPHAFTAFNTSDFACISCALATLFKLSFVDEYGWDISFVRQTADFSIYIEKCCKIFEQVGLALDQKQVSPCKPCFHTLCAQKMKRVKAWFDANSPTESNAFAKSVNEMSAGIGGMEDVFNDEYFNDGLWEQLMAETNIL